MSDMTREGRPAVGRGAGGDGVAALFSMRDLRVDFEGRTALSIDALDLEEGGITVLAGENGSGKTTLLRVLNGLLAPSSGTVRYRGGQITVGTGPGGAGGAGVVRSDSVLVHQDPLMFRGSVAQNVSYGLRARGVVRREIPSRVSESLARVGMAGSERRTASALSSGEKQRVAIARALALRPRVLLLDEPTANIDPEFRRSIEEVVRSTASSGTTLIMSSHDMEFAYRLCDRMITLEGGRLAASRENILRGRVARTDEAFTHFAVGSAELTCPARIGDFAVAVLPMDDVIISREPLASSARNRFSGTVSDIEEAEGLLRVTLACGFTVQALVTRAAAAELAIEPGKCCHVTFKASAIRLY